MEYEIICNIIDFTIPKLSQSPIYENIRYRMFHPITKTDHNQNGPLPNRTIEIKNIIFFNKYDNFMY